MLEQGQEVGCRTDQFDPERMIIESLDAHLIEIRDLFLEKSLAPFITKRMSTYWAPKVGVNIRL